MTAPTTEPQPAGPDGQHDHGQHDHDHTHGDHAHHHPPRPHSPAVLQHEAKRAQSAQLRVADAITTFAGSMSFVYLHIVVFAIWMLFVESNPWPTLTLAVSLEAIFLSTFVMIAQNRQSDFAKVKADHDFTQQESELHRNTEVTEAIHKLALEIHAMTCGPKQ